MEWDKNLRHQYLYSNLLIFRAKLVIIKKNGNLSLNFNNFINLTRLTDNLTKFIYTINYILYNLIKNFL